MSNEVLEKVKLLPPDEQQQVEDFIIGLLQKHDRSKLLKDLPLAERRHLSMGWAKGQIWMAEDFNDTPEDFKEYL